ncbi:NADH dehydrogenase [ubiquinone] 1 beta subcomplex subunit 6 [Pseudophryne corroboree]|uniref:NADH dehydrogenase [ubiquinone] 1 beta subcomplex subunit 6 n=1 Tax=Pseudophryne corroboree TaxID=495146 RepID=UPI0030814D89
MSVSPADEKLRQQQLRVLRRKWLKDQELSPREPVLPTTKPGVMQRFWGNFLQKNSLWRNYTFRTYNLGVTAVTKILIPAWIIHYFIKYHLETTPYAIVYQKLRVFPGDVIQETGEVIPPLDEPSNKHHH